MSANKVRDLNDAFRKNPCGLGNLLMTRNLIHRGNGFADRALDAVRDYDGFEKGNDPYGEHDFISVEIDGETVYGKIDCYDQSMQYGSPNPEDPNVTVRVLTIMLAEDY